MPSYRKLPSGAWQATVYGPGRKRHTKTDRLKSVVIDWAIKQEAAFKSGDRTDPRAGQITLREWHDEHWWPSRVVAESTAERDRKNLDRWVLPYLGTWKLNEFSKTRVQGWVNRLSREGGRDRDGNKKPLGAASVHLAFMVLSSMLRAAAEEDPPLIRSNPCSGVRLPRLPPKKRAYFTEAEMEAVLAHLREPYRTMAELSMWSGLRWEELAGLTGDRIDWLREVIPGISQVMTKQGLRPYPKSEESDRVIPIPPHLMPKLARMMEGRARSELVFINVRGRPVAYGTWYWNWTEALKAAGVAYRKPHTCRDTAASRLLQLGVSMWEVKQILGHASVTTTEGRYGHHDPDAYVRTKQAWRAREEMAENARQDQAGRGGARTAE